MRRMISFTPVANANLNIVDDSFHLDKNLEEGYYLINITEGMNGQTCVCFLKVDNSLARNNSTVFVPDKKADGKWSILYLLTEQPNILHVGTASSLPIGASVEVFRIA